MPRAPSSVEIRAVASSSAGSSPSTPSCDSTTFGTEIETAAATDEVIQKRLTALGGDGGVIAITPDGTMAWSFNSVGMYRARAADGQALQVGIYKDER